MNRNYKVIWNQSLNCFMAVAEYAKSRGKSSSSVVSSSVSANSTTGGTKLLRLSTLCAGLIAAGLSLQSFAGYEAGGGSTFTDCTTGVIGGTTKSTGIAIGANVAGQVACAPTGNSIAIGGEATTAGGVNNSNLQSIAIGNKTVASGDQSVALGANVIASGNSSVAVGGDDIDKIASNTTQAAQYYTITGGTLVSKSYPTTTASGAGASAFGVQTVASGNFSTALGMTSSATGAASVALGVSAKAAGQGALAIGAVSSASEKGSVALGINSKSSGLNSIAIGSGSTPTTGANSSGENATSIGSSSSAAANATAIGAGAKATEAGGVAIGTGSIANIAAGIKGFDPSTGGATDQTSNVWNSTRAAVALGDSATGITRQLTGLAAGTNDSDAVNVAQLKTVTNQTFKIQANDDTASAVKSSDTVQFIDGKNIKITRTGNNITFGTADNLTADSVTTGAATLSNTGLTITAANPANNVVLSSTGLNNGNNKITNIVAGTLSDTSTDAVNGSQLNATNKKVAINTTNITKNAGDITDLTTGKIGIVRQDAGTGAITVGAATGGTSVNFANQAGINRQLTGVASAGDIKAAANANNAVNAGDLNTAIGSVEGTIIDKGFALKAADGKTVQKKLGEAVEVIGANKNITTQVSVDGKVEIALSNALDLGATGSVTTGAATLSNTGLTITAANPANNVVLGSTGLNNGNNKITGVAAGTAATDAVNVSQLNSVANTATNTAPIVYTKANGAQVYKVGSQYFTNPEGTGTAVEAADIITSIRNAAGSTTTATKLSNIAAGTLSDTSTDAVNGSQLNATNKNVAINTTNITKNAGDITDLTTGKIGIVRQDAGTGAITVGAATGGTSINFANTTNESRKLTGVAAGSADNDAVNFSQLKTVSAKADNSVQYDQAGKTSITLGGGTGGTTITNVKAGTLSDTSTDAVNGAQLNATNKSVTKNTNDIATNAANITKAKTTVTAGNNVDVTPSINADGSANYIVKTKENLTLTSVTTGNSTLNTSGLTITGGPSVTSTGISAGNKKITGVVAGESATDAVNVGQLTNLQTVGNNKINQLGGNTATNLGGGATYNAATGAISQPSYKLNKNTITANNVGEALTNLDGRTSTNTDNIAINTANITKAKSSVSQGENILVTETKDSVTGASNYEVKTARALNLDSVTTGNSTLNTSGLTITAANPANNVVLGSTGLNNGNNKITNVAAGTLSDTSTDAVNGSQLNATNKNVTKNAGDITDLTIGKTGIVRQDAGTGALTVGAGTGGTSVSFAGIEGNRQLTGVASAGNITETANANNAVNAGDLNTAIGSVEGTIIDKGFALQAGDGKTVQKKLGEAVEVIGANENITTQVSADGKVEIALSNALDLGVNGSVTTGNTVTNNTGVRVDDGFGNITAVTTAGTKVIDTAGNSADYTATGSELIDTAGNTNISTAIGNIITNGDNVTRLTAAGTNVTDGTSTSNYGANGFTATDGTNTTTFNQTGLSFNDGSNNIGPSITAGGLNAGNTVITNVGEAINAGDAVNKGQLDTITGSIAAGGVQYARNPDNSVNYNQVILAGGPAVIDKDINGNNIVISGGTALNNVANGVIASDGVNKGQLDGATKVKVLDKNGNEITVNIADQIVNTNVNNSNSDSLFLTYNVKGQEVTDRLTIGETVQKMNTEGVKFAHTNAGNTSGDIGVTNDSSAGGINSTAIGVNAIIAAGASSTVALGHDTKASAGATNSVVIGKDSEVNGESSIAIGDGAQANGKQSISIGTGNKVNGDYSGAFGDPSTINGNNSYSVGNNNTIESDDTFVLGNGITVNQAGAVVLGKGSTATTGAGEIGYLENVNDVINNAIFLTRSTTGAVAVGNGIDVFRQITGVAAGTADSDAVNVAQLKAVNSALSDAAIQYDKDQNGDINKDNITLGGGTAGTTITNVTGGAINKDSTQAINGSQLHNLGSGIASIIGGNAAYDANGNLTASNIGGTGQSNINDAIASINSGNALATENIKANTDRLDKGLSFGADSGDNINKSVGDGTALKFEGSKNITTTATANGIKFDLNGNINVDSVTTGNTTVNNNGVTIKDGPSMTIDGIYAGNRTITGVADGIKVNDAVNLGQLNALDQKISNSINELGYKIGEVEDDANAGISAAMAMSSLPQAYIPGKSMIGGGVATYNGQSAVAVGISKVSDNGRWVIKANGTADTQGNAGGAIGAGFHF